MADRPRKRRCWKRRYSSEYAAEQAMRKTQAARGEAGARRYYHCSNCGGWHLTKAPLKPRPRQLRQQTQPRRRRDTGPSKTVRGLVLVRSGLRCERCGEPIAPARVTYSLQHRRARGMGGTSRPDANSPANLAVLCGSATTGCHGWVEHHPDTARAEGWRVDQHADPAEVPIRHWQHGWVYLLPDGSYRLTREGAA